MTTSPQEDLNAIETVLKDVERVLTDLKSQHIPIEDRFEISTALHSVAQALHTIQDDENGLRGKIAENIDQATLDRLASLGLSITPHSDPSVGWGYTWKGRDWAGPFSTPDAVLHASFTEALLALQFRSDYSWMFVAKPGEIWQYGGEAEGWTHAEPIERLTSKVESLEASIAMLRETTDTAIKHLASHVSHLALQVSLDHQQEAKEE